jgi:phage-related protein (TIGR01555 family)
MASERLDNVQALINLATGQGVGKYDPSQSGRIGVDGKSYLDQNTQAFYCRKHKILRKLVETIPNQMTYRWGELTLGGDDGDTKIIDAVDQWAKSLVTRTVYNKYIGLPAAFNAAQIEANETGNAALIVLADDGEDIENPLVTSKIKGIKGLYLVNRWAIKPDVQGLNLSGIEAGISHYVLTTQRAINGLKLVAANGRPLDLGNTRIHRSRVLWFRGEELSDYSLQQNQGCDDSVLEGVVQSFNEYNAGLRGAGRMLVDFDFFVHKINGYLDKMMGDGSKEYGIKMQERLQANSLMRSSYRGMAIDKELEEIDTVSRSVAGYSDLLEQVLSNFLSNTDLQPSELLQRYPSGLANTGKTEQQNSNDRTRLYQSKKFDSNLRDLFSIVFEWKGGPTKGVVPKVWDWKWHDLYPTTPLEQSELELNWAQIDASRIQAGVYTADDAAKSHYSTPQFNPSITIDFKERERLKKEQEQQALQAAQQGGTQEGAEDPLAGLTFDAADPFMVPQQVKDAAKKGLQIRQQIDSGAVPARVALLGRKLSAGEALTKVDAQTVQAYHQRNRKPPSQVGANLDTALYLLHGGPVGKAWADRALMPPKMDAVRMDKPCGEGFIAKEKQCRITGGERKFSNYRKRVINGLTEIRNGSNLTYIDRSLEVKGAYGSAGIQYTLTDLPEFNIPKGGNAKVLQTAARRSGKVTEITFFPYLASPSSFMGKDESVKSGMGAVQEILNREEKTKLALAAKQLGQKVLAQQDPGSLLVNRPTGGAGGARARIYEKMGFSKIEGKQVYQFAVVGSDRKLYPLQVYGAKPPTRSDSADDDLNLWIEAIFGDSPDIEPSRTDDDSPIKKTLDWKGFKIGLQYQPFDLRHEKLLPCGYGEIVGTMAADGMPLDCYVGTELDSDRVFVVSQLKADTGEFDEYKLFIGFTDDAPTIKDLFVSLMGQERFGGIKEIRPQDVLELTEDDDNERDDGTPPEAQVYIDAEERALAADGDVLDADEFDPEVDEVDASDAVGDWGEDGGQFQNVLEAE